MLDRFNGERPGVTHIYDKPTHLSSFDRLAAHRHHIIATYLEAASLTQTNIPTGRFLATQLLEDLREVQDATDIDIATILEGLPAANGQLLTPEIITWRECSYDPTSGIGRIHDREDYLTRLEGRIFHTLVQNGNKVVSYSRLIETVWQYLAHSGDLSGLLKTHVCHLREKLDDPDKPSHIKALIGRGYHLVSCTPSRSFSSRTQPQLSNGFIDTHEV